MKVNIIKPHSGYPLGEVDVPGSRANYLIRSGVAEEIKKDWLSKDQNEPEESIATKEDPPKLKPVKKTKPKKK